MIFYDRFSALLFPAEAIGLPPLVLDKGRAAMTIGTSRGPNQNRLDKGGD